MELIQKGGNYCSKNSSKDKILSNKEKEELDYFCKLLKNNKKKASQEAFDNLPEYVQCLFLEYSMYILLNRTEFSDEAYKTAFLLFKLFRGKDSQKKEIYERYASPKRKKEIEAGYKTANEWNKEKDDGEEGTKPKKNLTKKFQKQNEPTSSDATYIFYTSLRKENPKSRLAITWLTEHGVFDGEERKKLEKEYEKLAEKKGLIR
jgi:hypothetical protein